MKNLFKKNIIILILIQLFTFSSLIGQTASSNENKKKFSFDFGLSYHPLSMNIYDAYNDSNSDYFTSVYNMFIFGATYKPWLINHLYFLLGVTANELGSGFNFGFGIGHKGSMTTNLDYRVLYEFGIGPEIGDDLEYDSFYYAKHFINYEGDNASIFLTNNKLLSGVEYQLNNSDIYALKTYIDIGYVFYSEPSYTFITSAQDENYRYPTRQVGVKVPENKMRYQVKDINRTLFRIGLELSLGL